MGKISWFYFQKPATMEVSKQASEVTCEVNKHERGGEHCPREGFLSFLLQYPGPIKEAVTACEPLMLLWQCN